MIALIRASRYQQWHYPAPGTDPSQRREGEPIQADCGCSLVPFQAVTFNVLAIGRMMRFSEICKKCLAQPAEKDEAF